MSRRSSTLSNLAGLTADVSSKYDVIKAVSEYLAEIEAISTTDLAALTVSLNDAKDFAGITVEVGVAAGWDSVNKILTVPVEKGDVGIQGVQGIQGVVGPQGNNGITGNTGATGSTGLTGANGIQGQRGPKGDTGDQGIQGTDGLQGDVGPRGTGGSDGEDGLIGLQGVSVHHLKGTSTTDMEGDFGTYGELDTYTFYGDANETMNLGYYVVRNGFTVADGEALGIMYRKTFDTDETGIVDDSERLGGKPLAQVESERDSAIQVATLALGSNFTVADIAERDALIDINVGDKVYVTDNGDTKWAHYLVVSEAPIVFEVIMDEDTYLNANTAGSIKTTYESNLDTNAYTDAEQTKTGYITVTQPVDLDTVESRVSTLESETTDLTYVATVSDGTVTSSDGTDATIPAVGLDAGLMIPADKTKLDGVEALADVTDVTNVTSAGALMRTGGAVTGPISTTSTVDGRNVSVDGTKLDGIEALATADQTEAEIQALVFIAAANLTALT